MVVITVIMAIREPLICLFVKINTSFFFTLMYKTIVTTLLVYNLTFHVTVTTINQVSIVISI